MTNELEVQSQPAITDTIENNEDELALLRKAAHEMLDGVDDEETLLAAMTAMTAHPLDQAIRRVLRQPSKMYWTPNEIQEELMRSKDWAPLTKWGRLEPHNQKKNIATISNLLMSDTRCAHNPSDNTFCLRNRLP